MKFSFVIVYACGLILPCWLWFFLIFFLLWGSLHSDGNTQAASCILFVSNLIFLSETCFGLTKHYLLLSQIRHFLLSLKFKRNERSWSGLKVFLLHFKSHNFLFTMSPFIYFESSNNFQGMWVSFHWNIFVGIEDDSSFCSDIFLS